MNAIDIVILILLTLSTLNGLRQGLIHALANLIGWILSLILALRFHEQLKPWMSSVSSDQTVQSILAFVAIVVVVVVLTWLVGHFLYKTFKFLRLSWLNRLAGGAFGLAKSLVVFLILIHILNPWLSATTVWKNAKVVQWLQPYAATTTQYSQEIVQITTGQLESYQSDDNNRHQSDIIHGAKSSDDKNQMANPFR